MLQPRHRRNQKPVNESTKNKERSFYTRKRPLWDNCELQAPDGQALCTCDSRKANWYINKGLGVKVRLCLFYFKFSTAEPLISQLLTRTSFSLSCLERLNSIFPTCYQFCLLV